MEFTILKIVSEGIGQFKLLGCGYVRSTMCSNSVATIDQFLNSNPGD